MNTKKSRVRATISPSGREPMKIHNNKGTSKINARNRKDLISFVKIVSLGDEEVVS